MGNLGLASLACALACTGCGAFFPTELAPDDGGSDATQPAQDSAPDTYVGPDGGPGDGSIADVTSHGDAHGDAGKDAAPVSCLEGGTGVCAPDASATCGCGGTQKCGVDCLWGGCSAADCASGVICNAGQCCSAASVCQPGSMQSPTCAAGPACGNQPETCSACGQWVAQGGCTGATGCSPGATQGCNTYGTQTCGSNCTWGACTCPPNPTCVPWTIAVSGQSPGDGPICTSGMGAGCCVTQIPNVCGSAGECCGNIGTVCDACGQCGVPQCICLC